MRRGRLAILSVLLLQASTAYAGPKTHKPKILVLGFPAGIGLSAQDVAVLNDFLGGAIHDRGFSIVTPAGIETALGLEKQRQLLGCAESSCLAEIGGALGVDSIVRGNLALFEGGGAMTLVIFDSKGQVKNEVRTTFTGRQTPEMLRAVEHLVPLLMPNGEAPSASSAVTGAELVQPAPPRVSHTASYALFGVGGAAMVGGVAFAFLAKGEADQARDSQIGGVAAEQAFESHASAARRDAWICNGAIAAGVISVAAGAILYWVQGRSTDAAADGAHP